jgi:hypothetical protein
MRDAAGELADGLHLLGLEQLGCSLSLSSSARFLSLMSWAKAKTYSLPPYVM